MADSGTRQSDNARLEVTEARIDSLPWISEALKPGVPFSTRKPRMPSSARAHTIATSATDAVGDPGLLAVEDPVIAVFVGGRPHARGIRAEAGLGEAEASQRLARLQFRKPALFLFFRSVT